MLLYSQFVMAQGNALQKEVKKADSLIFYCNFSEGEKKVDSLLYQLSKSNRGQDELKLKLLLHKAYLYARDRKTNKALKVALDVIDQARKYALPEKEYQACLMAATMYEHSNELNVCKSYLDKAYKLYQENGLENVFSVYCIRSSSYYRFINKIELAVYYANKGIIYAQKYHNKREYIDGCLLLGSLLFSSDFQQAIKYSSLAANAFLKKNDYIGAASMYNKIATNYLNHREPNSSFKYSDSALRVFKKNMLPESDSFFRTRYRLFDTLGNKDSAYHYFQKYHDAYVKEVERKEAFEIKKITEQYENAKKEAVIGTKNQQMIFVIGLLIVITVAAVLIVKKNRRINVQNKIISKQVDELLKVLEQKQMLLSELQHRVKNNLQHVISILEIQKESVDFNNIDEVIQGSQNRIQSMALLHKMLDISENVNDIDLSRYITELSELVKDSYDIKRKKINLHIACDIQTISAEKALPIGLIAVELVSNSMKHAFRKQNTGDIKIYLTNQNDKYQFYYADNGSGHDFNVVNEKGLGIEIVKGLVGQLDATIESDKTQGFKLILHFK